MHEQKNENVWLSKATEQLREDARKTAGELATVNSKCDKIVNTDGDVDAQTKALTELHARRDILAAKLARLRSSLFDSVQADARAEHAAAVEAVAQSKAKGAALRDLWRTQVKADCKDSGASKTMQADSKYWPRELRDCASESAALQQRVADAAKRMQAVSWDSHAAAKARDAAIPCGGWQGKATFWNAAALLVPELGTMAPETAGTLVFGR